MLGLMMKHDLMISDLIEHAEKVHGDQEIYTLETNGSEHKYTWRDCAKRVRKLANTLLAQGVKKGDRVATIAWNNYCLLYTSPSPRDQRGSRMPSSA